MKANLFALTMVAVALAPKAGQAQAPKPIVTEGIVDGSVAEVWKVFSTSEGWASCLVAKAEVDLRPMGMIRTHYDKNANLGDPGTIQNQVLAFDPERMLSIRIAKPPETFPWKKAAQSTWTVIYMEPAGTGKTKVTVRMMGWTDDEESRTMHKFFVSGNQQTLDALKKHFAK